MRKNEDVLGVNGGEEGAPERLIQCPECGHKHNFYDLACPECGYRYTGNELREDPKNDAKREAELEYQIEQQKEQEKTGWFGRKKKDKPGWEL